MTDVVMQPATWDRMIHAVERVRDRLHRVTATLDTAGVPYAVVGGHAVASWVARVDVAAVRNTQDVALLLRRADLETAQAALLATGFVYRHVKGVDMFLDGPDAKVRDAVHLVFAGECVRPDYPLPAPDVLESERTPAFQVLTLEALVRMKLTSFRDKDRVHVRDLIDVGLVDSSWLARLPEPLASRLQMLLEDPDG